jgi:ABC-type nitrate/sulfonate/bicarbonate transport system permease component
MKKQELIGVLILLIVWELFTKLANNYFFPGLELVWANAIIKIELPELFQNLGVTIGKTLASFLVGSFFGIFFGSIISTNKTLSILSSFTIDFMRSLPSIVIFPLFMIVFGINDWTKVLVTAFGVFWIVLFGTVQSVGALDKTKIKYLKIHGANEWQLFRHYIFFVLFQNWLTTLKITLTLSLFITIVLEMFIGSEYGIGKAIVDAKNYYEIPVMYFWIIIAGLVGYALNKIIVLIEKIFA